MSPVVVSNSLEVWYDAFGSPDDAPLLLISGLGSQAVNWEVPFCTALVEQGFFVLRYDLRDVGLSAKLDHAPIPDIGAFVRGESPVVPYRLDDLVDDALGLLDVLGIDSAHIVGRSLGGMIAQSMALRHPERVRSLALLSTSAKYPPDAQSAVDPTATSLVRPLNLSREETIAAMVEGYRQRGSRDFGVTDQQLFARATREYDRCYYPPGVTRQMMAVLVAGDRSDALSALAIPTVVLHGSDDPLVHVGGGEALAKAIPRAEWVLIEGMAHDLPEMVWSVVIEAIGRNTRRVS